MQGRLTAQAKKLLAQQYDNLLHDDTAFSTKVATVKYILQWCANEDINPGKWIVADKKYRFCRDSISKIRDIYLLTTQEDIFSDFSQDNHQTASAKSADEKQGAIKPTHHLILAAITDGSCFEHFQQAFYDCPQMNVELVTSCIDFSTYDALLMIENRDSFNDWHLFEAQISTYLGKVLAIYRGDSHYSVAATNLLKHWRISCHSRPVIYFGDFDLAGLRIAVSGKCSHLLLPETNWLNCHLVSQHYPVEQEKFLAGLETDCPKGWQPLLQLMSKSRAGLRQQKMYQIPLCIYPVDSSN